MNRFPDQIMFYLQWIVILITIPGLIAPYINPQLITLPAFSGLIFPYATIILLLISGFGLYRKQFRFFPALVVLILSFNAIGKTWGFHLFDSPEKDDHAGQDSLSLMSYNVQGFGRYRNDSVVNDYVGLFRQQDPDFLCLQEFFAKTNLPENNFQQVLRDSDYKAYHANSTGYREGNRQFFGLVIFSKRTIINKGHLNFDNASANGCIYIDINWHSDTVRIFNVHLQSTQLFPSQRLDKPGNDPDVFTNIIPRIKKLHRGFIKRAPQARKLAKAITSSPHPVVLCGDFNDPPVSYSYQQVSRNLNDAFLSTGFGFGTTYAQTFPFLRIDYVFLDNQITPMNFRIIENYLSDHFPVLCLLKKEPPDE